MMWAILPVKGLEGAKQRLGAVLTRRQRRDLARAMVEDVLEALAAVKTLAGIAVVSRDPAVATLAERYGARVVLEPKSRGQTAAVTAAANLLTSEGAVGALAVPGDVPLIDSAEIEGVLAAHTGAPFTTPSMTIVPARDSLGTNGIACSPPNGIAFQFGADSFRRHLEAARARAVPTATLRLPGFGLDIDTPADLAALCDRHGSARAQVYLKASGIAARLRNGAGRSVGRSGG